MASQSFLCKSCNVALAISPDGKAICPSCKEVVGINFQMNPQMVTSEFNKEAPPANQQSPQKNTEKSPTRRRLNQTQRLNRTQRISRVERQKNTRRLNATQRIAKQNLAQTQEREGVSPPQKPAQTQIKEKPTRMSRTQRLRMEKKPVSKKLPLIIAVFVTANIVVLLIFSLLSTQYKPPQKKKRVPQKKIVFAKQDPLLEKKTASSSEKEKPPLENKHNQHSLRRESDRLRGDICEDIIQTLYYAKKGHFLPSEMIFFSHSKNSSLGELLLDINFPEGSVSHRFSQNLVWSPQAYIPLVESISKTLELPLKPEHIISSTVIEKLLKPQSMVLAQESQRLTQLFKQDLLSKDYHTQAAVILGTLALRESASQFSDTRRLLCRMTTHLTLAGCSEKDSSAKGEVKEIALALFLTLKGQQSEALARMEKWTEPSSVMKAWKNALTLRNTHDWRILSAEKKSLLEMMELYRAIIYNYNTTAGIRLLSQLEIELLTDWTHVALANDMSVGDGHHFIPSALEVEIAEISTFWPIYQSTPIDLTKLQTTLNEPGNRFFINENNSHLPEVLSWGTWASFYQRHICFVLQKSMNFYKNSWGVREEANKFYAEVYKTFSQWDLFPFFACNYTRNFGELQEMMKRIRALAKENHERITFPNWLDIKDKLHKGAISDITNLDYWFSPKSFLQEPFFIVETAQRERKHLKYFTTLDEAQTLWSQAPYEYRICNKYLRARYPGNYNYEQAQEVLGKLSEYHLDSMVVLASLVKDDPDLYLNLYEEICRRDPDRYIQLGHYLVDQGKDKKAAEAYQYAYDLAPSRVMVSNSCQWLVNYYYDQGKVDKALKIASGVAEVYSYQGLKTMADLLDKMGELSTAKDYYEKIEQRYESNKDLIAFYLRHQDIWEGKMLSLRGDKIAFVERKINLIEAFSPQKISYGTLSRTKDIGVVVTSVTKESLAKKANLQQGDIILSINDFRIYASGEYNLFTQGLKLQNSLTFLVNRDGKIFQTRLAAQLANNLGFQHVHVHNALEKTLDKHRVSVNPELSSLELFPSRAIAHLDLWLQSKKRTQKERAWIEEVLLLYSALGDKEYSQAKKVKRKIPIPLWRQLAKFYSSLAQEDPISNGEINWKPHHPDKDFFVLNYPYPRYTYPPVGEIQHPDQEFLSLFKQLQSDPLGSFSERSEAAFKCLRKKTESKGEEYFYQVLASLLDEGNHGGWPYRSVLIVDNRHQVVRYLKEKYNQAKEPAAKILYAYSLIFPAVSTNDGQMLAEMLATIERSPFLTLLTLRKILTSQEYISKADYTSWIKQHIQNRQLVFHKKPSPLLETLLRISPTIEQKFAFLPVAYDTNDHMVGIGEFLYSQPQIFREALKDYNKWMKKGESKTF